MQFDNIPANVTANGLAVAPSPGDKFAVALNVQVPAPAALAADGHNEQPSAATSGAQHRMIALLTWFLSRSVESEDYNLLHHESTGEAPGAGVPGRVPWAARCWLGRGRRGECPGGPLLD
jgi:hypothetical protein